MFVRSCAKDGANYIQQPCIQYGKYRVNYGVIDCFSVGTGRKLLLFNMVN